MFSHNNDKDYFYTVI